MPSVNKKGRTGAKTKGISLRAFARAVGLSAPGAKKAIDSGRVTRNKDGTIDLENGKRDLKANTNPLYNPGKEKQDLPPSFLQAWAIKEFYQAQMAKLEYEIAVGKVIDADLVKSQTFQVHRIVRDSVMNVPRRVAALVASRNKKDQEWTYKLMSREITEACKVLGDPNEAP